MKKTITLILAFFLVQTHAQNVADFESFSLPADSFYYNSTTKDWQTNNAVFQYEWDTNFGGFWSKGFSYTNKNDTANGGFMNLYNCAAGKGYNNSNYYVSAQNNGIIRLKTATDNKVDGFYITNSTYAYKSMKNGDAFAKKFGGTSGNDPDWFKITIKGFLGGTMKTDSTEFYLADFRSNNNSLDYILKTWQWVNCSNLGVVDSIQFFMYSSDVGSFGMNTPAFFNIDNFTTSKVVGIKENTLFAQFNSYPNPASDNIYFSLISNETFDTEIKIINALGVEVRKENKNIQAGPNNFQLNISELASGLYFIEMNHQENKHTYKLIKN